MSDCHVKGICPGFPTSDNESLSTDGPIVTVRILVLDYKDPWHNESGGAQFYVQQITGEWVLKGHEVTVFTSRNERPWSEIVSGVRYLRQGNKFTVFHSAKVYLAQHGDEYDLVLDTVNQRPFLAHEIVGDKSTSLVFHLGLEIWNSEFGFPFNLIGSKILEPEWMRRLQLAPRVLAISSSTALSLAQYGIECDGIIPPASLPMEPVLDRHLASNPRILFIGRMVNNKRPLDAVNAFVLLKQEFPTLSMDVIGSGYLLDKLGEFESPDLRVWGYVAEEVKESLIRKADLLFVTSVREGWGMVVTEAAAFGVPSVAYDVPGLRDSIEDGVTGILTSESPRALADGAASLLKDPERWSMLSTSAAKRATSWLWSAAAESLLGFMMALPLRDTWVRSDPDQPRPSVKRSPHPEATKRFDLSNRARSIAVIVTAIAIGAGLLLRIYVAEHMPWREDEIVYVQWTGSWFANHLFSYVFQFQQHLYPPKSQYFANPPFVMWIFGVAIRIGRAFSVSALHAARLADVAISVLTNVLLFRTARRWLGSGVAAFAACTFAVLPLAITTGASAFIEPTMALLTVLTLDAYLRLKESVSWPRAMYLASVLGMVLVTKLSLVLVFLLIGLSALVHLVRSGRRAVSTAFVVVPLALPLLLWSGYRTPSQYRGVIGFLAAKYSSLTISVDHLRFPFSTLNDFPLLVLVAWFVVLVSPLAVERIRNRAPTNLLFIAVLPAVGIVELMLTAPTSWDYQLLPLVPFVLLPAGWALRRAIVRPHLRRVLASLIVIGFGEIAFMLFAQPLGQLSLAMSPTAAVVRNFAPHLDVPYGTGSEELPQIANYINTRLPEDVRVAATYANYPLGKYLKASSSIGSWFPSEPLSSLSADGYQYGVLVAHYASSGTVAAKSVDGMQPIYAVHMTGDSYAAIYRVPFPASTRDHVVNLSGPWSVQSLGISTNSYLAVQDHLSITGHVKRNATADRYLTITDDKAFAIGPDSTGVKVVLRGHGGSENVYVDLVSQQQGSYLRATVYVNWIGTHTVWLPPSAFLPMAVVAKAPAPVWGGIVNLRLGTDGQRGVAPYIDVSYIAVDQSNTAGPAA